MHACTCRFTCATLFKVVHSSATLACAPRLSDPHSLVPSSVTSAAQVVYPALDAKVKNVTIAYSHEHRDEVSVRC